MCRVTIKSWIQNTFACAKAAWFLHMCSDVRIEVSLTNLCFHSNNKLKLHPNKKNRAEWHGVIQ